MMNGSSAGPVDGPETNGANKYAKRSTFAQLLATLIQSWLLIGVGMELAMPTIVLAALHNHPTEKLNMNDAEASWFASLPNFVHPIGSLLSGYLQERFGRKGTMTWINIPILIGWLTLYFANSITALYVGCILIGLCSGLCEAPLHSYIGEMAEPHIRGTLSTLSTCAIGVSRLLMYSVGYILDWRATILVSSAVPVMAFICMTQIPESPTWLIARDRLEEAQKSLSWLRGWVKPEEVHEEFQELVRYTKNSREEKNLGSIKQKSYDAVQSNENEKSFVCWKNLKTKFREMTNETVLRPLRMVLIVFFIDVTSGLNFMKPYLVEIFDGFKAPDSKAILVYYGAVTLVGMLSNMVILRHFGKRRIALLTQLAATACMLTVAVSCSIFHGPRQFPGFWWIPAILLLASKLFTGLGVSPLGWQLLSEVFPPKGRGTASGISAAWAHTLMFITIKSYLYLEAWLTFSGVMYLYGVIALLGLLYFYFYLPETEGKTLEQIETYFTKDYNRQESFTMRKSA